MRPALAGPRPHAAQPPLRRAPAHLLDHGPPGRSTRAGSLRPHADDGTGPQRTIADAQGTRDHPGQRRSAPRASRPPATRRPTRPTTGSARPGALYDEAYRRDSLDGQGLPLLGTVHYGQGYDNAFWDGTQMVFGDGDGTVFNRLHHRGRRHRPRAHPRRHRAHRRRSTTRASPAPSTSSVSDVFGSLVKQHALGQAAAEADWLIGAGLFTGQVKGVALRSMKAPGTAYDDPQLGKDPQPATMAGYVETTDDNGGVHINSGIPNHAFYLAATAIGGNAWEGAGQVWFDVLTGGRLAATADFAAFARLTVAAAESRYAAGSPQASAIRAAWEQVGVLDRAGSGWSRRRAPATGADRLGDPTTRTSPAPGRRCAAAGPRSRCAGPAAWPGCAGPAPSPWTTCRTRTPRAGARCWPTTACSSWPPRPPGRPIPDAFTYHVACPPEGEEVTLPEHGIPEPVRDLFQRTLGD